MESARARHVFRVIVRLCQNLVPHPKTHHHFERHRHKSFRLRCIFFQKIRGHFPDHGADVFHRQRTLSCHHRRVRQHMAIVRDVDIDESNRRTRDLPITAVSRDGSQIGIDGLTPAPASNVDVGWHVHVMRHARLQGAQPIRCRRCALRMKRRFVRVNVEMIGKRMPRVQFQDSIQRRENLVCAWIGLTFGRPLIPGSQIHHGFGEKRADIGVVRILLPNRAHGVGISLIERRAVLRLRVGVTTTERFDQIALHWRRVFRILLSELEFLPRQLRRRWRHDRKINVRSTGERDSPMRHRAFRVELRRFLKRTNGCAMIKTMQKCQSLIEIALCFRRIGCDPARIGTEPFEKGLRRLRGDSDQQSAQNRNSTREKRNGHVQTSLATVVLFRY